jgi:hypothetical protein
MVRVRLAHDKVAAGLCHAVEPYGQGQGGVVPLGCAAEAVFRTLSALRKAGAGAASAEPMNGMFTS